MLHPDVVVDKSPFGGKGLFAQKKIPLGTIVWKWDENNERIYSNSQIQEFSKKYRHMILKYGNEYQVAKSTTVRTSQSIGIIVAIRTLPH